MDIKEFELRVGNVLKSQDVNYDYLDEFSCRDGKYIFDIGAMYEPVNLTFDTLNTLAKEFDTMHVDVDAGETYGGCETCDHGSRYGHEITIIPGLGFKA